MMIIQIAIGVALAPVVFAIGVAALCAIRNVLSNVWYDHPEFTSTVGIAAACGVLVLVLYSAG